MPAADLFRRVIDRELTVQREDHTHWMYQAKVDGTKRVDVKLVIETGQGDLDHLQSVDGRPITPQQEGREERRIEKLVRTRSEIRKQKREQEQDARRMTRMMKLMPEALAVSYGERKGDLVELRFEPNPAFHPSSHEAAVLHDMEGRIWVDSKQDRLAEIEGHLIRDVKFGGGLLGYLRRGGEFHVKQSEVAPDHWEVTMIHIDMHGKALFFKTIRVHENEERSDFRRVPDDLTLAQAAEELKKQYKEESQAVERGPRTDDRQAKVQADAG